MFAKITPEQAGIPSCAVAKFIQTLERRGLFMHSVLLMKGNDLFGEFYWKPFHKDFCHRMYSQTKSFVSVAIGLLEEDGLLNLNDPIATYFPDKYTRELPAYLQQMTIHQMLTMQTCGDTPSWFYHEEPDRTRLYFEQNYCTHPAGHQFRYDSAGSQVLSTLVERLTKTTLFDFLNQRIFRHLNAFQTATIRKTKNDDSFGDSALVCTTRDMAAFARFVMNYGTWNGKRLINEAYLRTATSRLVDNNRTGFDHSFTEGYGYQIWRTQEDGFAFNGMGCQLTICIPKKDLIFCCTADNQGLDSAKDLIYSAFFEQIVDYMGDAPLAENATAYAQCTALEDQLTLGCLRGDADSDFASQISGKTYRFVENSAGFRQFSLQFFPDHTGELCYVNEQGEKHLSFGLGKNVFGKFPQDGYSTLHAGSANEEGYLYDCAACAVWGEAQNLRMKVQIIDQYLGNLHMIFSFRDDVAFVSMTKKAEAFLDEYQGSFLAYRCD